MLTFIHYAKCTTCKKAKILLDSHQALYKTRDIKSANPSYDELKEWLPLSGLPVRKFFNSSGQLYRSLGLKDKLHSMSEDDCLRLLATDGMLVKRPLLIDDNRILVGFNKVEWESVFDEYNNGKPERLLDGCCGKPLEIAPAGDRNSDNAANAAPLDSYRSKDHEAFHLKGLGDSYEKLGSLNLFMQCKNLRSDAFRLLPEGYSFRLCRRDELETWKRIVAEEQYVDLITKYYNDVYAAHEDEFFKRCVFVCNADDKPIASCLVWRSYGLIYTIGWFRVLPEYEGQGIGRALLSKVLHGISLPIYLHTQPTSMRAIKLYSDFGFRLITDPVVGHRKNDLDECRSLLSAILPMDDFSSIQYTKADDALLTAALSREISEF